MTTAGWDCFTGAQPMATFWRQLVAPSGWLVDLCAPLGRPDNACEPAFRGFAAWQMAWAVPAPLSAPPRL